MKKQLLVGAGNFVRRLLTGTTLLCAVVFAVSCNDDDPNAERGEFIHVYADMDGEPVDIGHLDVRGGQAAVYVKANVEYEVSWQDSETKPWVEVIETRKNAKQGFDQIILEVKPRQTYSYYTRRTGSLLFSSSKDMLGKFVPVHQGAIARISQAFAWLSYGNANPLVTDGEKAYSGWTAIQKNYDWTTSTPEYTFGKSGYVKLGDDAGHGADFVTPLTADLRNDSLLMVSFRAVAYSDENNVTDNKKLTVNILGGGVFADTELSTREVQIGTYTVEDGEPVDMWADSNYLLFVTSIENNPITANTRIQFVAGDLNQAGTKNNRTFLDNIYVYTLNEFSIYMMEDNEGTDKDIILGNIEEEEE